ncbi:MAG: protein-L-isoaspartate(D-aspartate) O-methyltransferase [Thermoplasmata archaeon]
MMDLKTLIENLKNEGFIKKKEVEEAMLGVDRKNFVLSEFENEAYIDEPLPTLNGQTVSAPHMVAMMLELLDIEPGNKILEIGTGLGYNTCLLASLSRNGYVYSVEIDRSLYLIAIEKINNYCNFRERIFLFNRDGSGGLPEFSPYDRIIITCGIPVINENFIKQLNNNGILLAPVGNNYNQQLLKITKMDNKIIKEYLGDVAFVPMKGKYGFREK